MILKETKEELLYN